MHSNTSRRRRRISKTTPTERRALPLTRRLSYAILMLNWNNRYSRFTQNCVDMARRIYSHHIPQQKGCGHSGDVPYRWCDTARIRQIPHAGYESCRIHWSTHPNVKGALMIPVGEHFRERDLHPRSVFWWNRRMDGISVADAEKKEKLLEEIWLIKDQTNGRFGKGAQIKRECIVFADPEIPIPRSPKGSIRRSAAMELYAKELCSLW